MGYSAPVLTCVLMAFLTACGGDSGGSTGPTGGILEIIVSTTGSELDPTATFCRWIMARLTLCPPTAPTQLRRSAPELTR